MLVTLYVGLRDHAGRYYDDFDILRIVGRTYDGFSYADTSGYWKGKAEPSGRVDLVLPNEPHEFDKLQRLVQDLKTELNQESVLVVYHQTREVFA